MLFDNALHRVEAQACSLAYSFCCKKGFKDVRFYFGRDSRAVVSNLNHYATVIAIGSDPQLTFAAHGIDGIVDNSLPNEFTSNGVGR
jgi:hypothetical protein